MKNKLLPERPYEKAQIDKFYWAYSDWNYTMFPLIKPIVLMQYQGNKDWWLNTSKINGQLTDISPVESFNVSQNYIYGYKPIEKDLDNPTFDSPEKWFIVNTKEKKLTFFDKETEFKAELKKLNLPEEMLTPDAVYEQYKTDPVLPWFPEDIKKQLEEAKEAKK